MPEDSDEKHKKDRSGENTQCPECKMIQPAERNFCTQCGIMLPSADSDEIDYLNGNKGDEEGSEE